MKAVRRPLLILDRSSQLSAALRTEALQCLHPVECADMGSLLDRARRAPLGVVVIITEGPSSGDPGIRPTLRDLDGISFCGIIWASPDPADLAVRLGDAPAEMICLSTELTSAAIAARVMDAETAVVEQLAGRLFGVEQPPGRREILVAAIRAATTGGDARSMAREFGIDRRVLTERCQAAELPPPKRLLSWTRILLAAVMIDQPWRSLASVSQALGYSDLTALRTTTKTHLGMSPKQLRQGGALATALSAFRTDSRPVRVSKPA